MKTSGIGVFVCECGDKIAGYLDVPALTRQASELPGVVWAEHAGYWCLPGGLERMRQIVAGQGLERVVIAGCAPRTHERFFRQALGDMKPTLVNVVNLRDLCARPHQDNPAAALSKACDQVAMGVAELAARHPGAPRVAHITSHAVVIGGGVTGMTAALGISEASIPVTLVERRPNLGGLAHLQPDDREIASLVQERIASVRTRPNIDVLTNAQVTGVSGPVGRYQVTLSDGRTVEAGAIIVATGGTPNLQPFDYPLDGPTELTEVSAQARHPILQLRFSTRSGGASGQASELKTQNSKLKTQNYAFLLCDITPSEQSSCRHVCCLSAFRQAADIKRQSSDSEVTIFFRELYTAGGTYNELVWEAQRLGVNFVRYPAGCPPQPVDGTIVTYDELTGREVHVQCDRAIAAAPPAPQEDVAHLARMLRLPIDDAGFLADARVRLRPTDRIERGIYVCGAAHYPCDAQRAMFEAYSAAARAVRHIEREQIITWAPPAVIDATRCNGCGDCVKVCPFMAVTLQARQGDQEIRRRGDKETGRRGEGERGTRRRESGESIPPLAVVDALVCAGCGNCVSVCPVKAAEVATASDELIEAQIREALRTRRPKEGEKKRHGEDHLVTVSGAASPCHCKRSGVTPSPPLPVLIFACEWSGYSAAEIAGAEGLSYPASTRLIRLTCTGRLQPGLILKALEMGAAGVLILGCTPGVCHFEQGNEHCHAIFEQANALAHLMGLDDRLRLEWIPPDDGAEFVRVVEDFIAGLEK